MIKEFKRGRILRLPEVQILTGLSRSTIYEQINLGQFPRSVSLGSRSVGWIESEVDNWIATRIIRRDQKSVQLIARGKK